MAKKIKFFVILTFSILCLLLPQVAKALNYEEISQTAKAITVLIDGCNSGSGVIYQRQGNNYYVLTAKHVFENSAVGCLAIAPDGSRYEINSSNIIPVANVDLAVFNFNSNQTYNLATIGNSQQVSSGKNIYVAGAPEPTTAIPKRTTLVVSGNVVGRQSSQDGYELIYSNATNRGMSGGAVLNTQGQVIGIHGQGDRINREKTGFNLAIPIETFLKVNIANFPKPVLSSNPSPPPVEKEEAEVNYSTLEKQLNKSFWKEANETTVKLMLQSVGRESEGWFTKESFAKLPCKQLKTIDILWHKYSNEKFGFRVQKSVFEETVLQQGARDSSNIDKFSENVGWRSFQFLEILEKKYYTEVNYNLNAQKGHLPALPGVLPLPEKLDPGVEALKAESSPYALWTSFFFFLCLFFLPNFLLIDLSSEYGYSNNISDFIVTRLLKLPEPKYPEYPSYSDISPDVKLSEMNRLILELNEHQEIHRNHKLKLDEYELEKRNREKIFKKIFRTIKAIQLILAVILICLFLSNCSKFNTLNKEYEQKKTALQQSIPTSGSPVLAGIEPLMSTLDRCGFEKVK